MEFDLSKENIQPLRGGRNATQLGVALQAQNSEEYQRELLQQKEEFENAIRNYDGEDPLENWYHYISWVEQSYPKHGHEGNLVPLLEDCLKKFEDDKRYVNDRRFCKIWIKFIDLHQNPLELYHMLHAKGLCRGCSDLYRAWAYYHEVAGDFRMADTVFQLGIRVLAQPYEELISAHENMIYTAGQQVISGIDERRLAEQREALMTLRTYKPGKVSNVRVASSSNAATLPFKASSIKTNIPVAVYEEESHDNRGAEAAPLSVLSIAKREDTPKENTLKPGAWTTLPGRKMTFMHRSPAFIVHEDSNVHANGIIVPQDFFTVTHEDYSAWQPLLIYPEPEDHTQIRKYPKAMVYADRNTEYSIEEIKGRKYLVRPTTSLNVSQQETQQAIKSILDDASDAMQLTINDEVQQHILVTQQQTQYNTPHYGSEYLQHHDHNLHHEQQNLHHQQQSLHHQQYSYQYQQQHLQQCQSLQYHQQGLHHEPGNLHQEKVFQGNFLQQKLDQQQNLSLQQTVQQQNCQEQAFNHPQKLQHQADFQQQRLQHQQQNFLMRGCEQQQNFQQPTLETHTLDQQHSLQQQQQNLYQQQQCFLKQSSIEHDQIQSPSRASEIKSSWPTSSLINSAVNSSSTYAGNNPYNGSLRMNDIWNSPNESVAESGPKQKNNQTKFAIFEESNIGLQLQPKGNAMKTPFKDLTDDDLAETGSRGGLEIAAAAQPIDEAKNVINPDSDSDDINSSPEACWLNVTNTQVFNFNAMHVSTPQSKMCVKDDNKTNMKFDTKKQLFGEPEKILSTIFEETKSYGSSLSSGSSSSKSQSKTNPLTTIGEEQNNYHFNLAQNLKANAALRSSLLGDFMECESQETSPIAETPPPLPQCTTIVPLTYAPSDPFKVSLVRDLLERIKFPGPHSCGYCKMFTMPRLNVKKELVNIGDDKYYVEKILGKGTYGSVYKAVAYATKEVVALKIQKPPNKWEFYICRELQARLNGHPLKDQFMDITIGYFNDQASVFVSDFSPNGSLLDVANLVKLKTGRPMKECLCIYFCIEMLKIINVLHQVKIIHADVKPDNFLVQLIDNNVKLQLIDFGCSIDMSMFPDNTTFMRRVTTDHFVCCEMLDGRPWSYHTDLFCVAATAHVLLFDKYIDMQKKDGHWSIIHRFSRYWRIDCWNNFFSSLLNQQAGPANPEILITNLSDVLNTSNIDFHTDIRFLVNLLKGR